MSAAVRTNHALEGKILPTFFRYWLPSLFGLLAMSTASIVDGLFIGNLVGGHALAAVNLIIPFFGLLFGLTFMLTMGGSVRAGKYIGEGDHLAASNIFSKTLMLVLLLALLVTAIGFAAEDALLRALGGNDALLPLMRSYWRITLLFVWTQLMTVALYFFVRVDGFPNLAAAALTLGAVVNIALDWLFIAHLGWGLAGAAWATGISQALPMLVLLTYLLRSEKHLHFRWRQRQWSELLRSAFNGLSEFVNEVSGSIMALLLNWLFITRFGVDGVAAITVLNYLLVIGMMLVFSMADSCTVFVSQNFGARQQHRIEQYLRTVSWAALLVAALCIVVLLGFTESLVLAFLPAEEQAIAALAIELIGWIWPLFLVNGLTMIISAYLTALHLSLQSSSIALARALVLPMGLLLLLYFLRPDWPFIIALPLAELVTFVWALYLLRRYSPKRMLGQPDQPQ